MNEGGGGGRRSAFYGVLSCSAESSRAAQYGFFCGEHTHMETRGEINTGWHWLNYNIKGMTIFVFISSYLH